ncbi:unnamed protein product, partial [Didymodactylos carnosus]
ITDIIMSEISLKNLLGHNSCDDLNYGSITDINNEQKATSSKV